jgi:hypothetical protein
MRRLPAPTLALAFSLASAALAGAGEPATVFEKPLPELMPAAEFQASGLSKLTPGELARLQTWLERHASGRTEVLARAAVREEVRKQAAEQGIQTFDTPTERRFESRIVGTLPGIRFRGQLVTLENGQIWRIADSFTTRAEFRNPEVRLRSGALGSGYFMTISGLGEDIRVERVK